MELCSAPCFSAHPPEEDTEKPPRSSLEFLIPRQAHCWQCSTDQKRMQNWFHRIIIVQSAALQFQFGQPPFRRQDVR